MRNILDFGFWILDSGKGGGGTREGRPESSRGFVMICVLWVLAILTVLTLGFGRRAMLNRVAATYSLDHSRAMFLARGATERGIAELRNKAVFDRFKREPPHTSLDQRWARPGNLFSGDTEYFSIGGEGDYADDICEYRIRDDCSRLNINTVDEAVLKEVDSLSFAVKRRVMVRRLGDPRSRNIPQPFQCTQELRYMDGVDEEDWFGTDRAPGLRDLFTTWGTGRVNINTASPEVLACLPGLKRDGAAAIAAYRAGSDGELDTEDDQSFKSIDDARTEAGIEGGALDALIRYCTVDSGFFTIEGVATLRNGKIRATCKATVMIQPPTAWVLKWREDSLEP